MSDKPIIDDPPTEAPKSSDAWVMPKPVFRSTEGHTPATAKSAFEADDIPTEIANKEDSAFPIPQSQITPETASGPAPDVTEPNADDVDTEEPHATPKTRGGCASSFLFILSMIGLVAAAIIIALFYFLFYYRPAETGTF